MTKRTPSLSQMQLLLTDCEEYSTPPDDTPKNTPYSLIRATVYRNAIASLEVYRDVEVTLDKNGIHGTCVLEGIYTPLQRLNSTLDYSFDAPDTQHLYDVSGTPIHGDHPLHIVAHSEGEACELACSRFTQNTHAFYTSANFTATLHRYI